MSEEPKPNIYEEGEAARISLQKVAFATIEHEYTRLVSVSPREDATLALMEAAKTLKRAATSIHMAANMLAHIGDDTGARFRRENAREYDALASACRVVIYALKKLEGNDGLVPSDGAD